MSRSDFNSAFFAFMDKLKTYPEKTQKVIYFYLLKVGFEATGELILRNVLGGKNNESE